MSTRDGSVATRHGNRSKMEGSLQIRIRRAHGRVNHHQNRKRRAQIRTPLYVVIIYYHCYRAFIVLLSWLPQLSFELPKVRRPIPAKPFIDLPAFGPFATLNFKSS